MHTDVERTDCFLNSMRVLGGGKKLAVDTAKLRESHAVDGGIGL